MHVTLLDSSPAMLEIAKRTAQGAGVTDKVVLRHGDATQLANSFHARSFDVILCHNVLEYLDDPIAVLCGAARALQDSSRPTHIDNATRICHSLKAVRLAVFQPF
jgi:S-adenosylmethionine-dependent methyltransferase